MSVQDGGKAGIIGATRNYGLTPEEALQEIGREVKLTAADGVVVVSVLLAGLSSWSVYGCSLCYVIAFLLTSTAYCRLLLKSSMMSLLSPIICPGAQRSP